MEDIRAYEKDHEGYMTTTKTATLTFQIDPGLKETLRATTHQAHRFTANMIEALIRGYCEANDNDTAVSSPQNFANNNRE